MKILPAPRFPNLPEHRGDLPCRPINDLISPVILPKYPGDPSIKISLDIICLSTSVKSSLNDKEQYILDKKFKLSGMKSKSAFIRKLILYGYVYDADYRFLREYNTEFGRISSSLNQIAKRINSTNHVYQEDMDEVKELMKQVYAHECCRCGYARPGGCIQGLGVRGNALYKTARLTVAPGLRSSRCPVCHGGQS